MTLVKSHRMENKTMGHAEVPSVCIHLDEHGVWPHSPAARAYGAAVSAGGRRGQVLQGLGAWGADTCSPLAWRLEVQGQHVSRSGASRGPPPPNADGCHLAGSPRGLVSPPLLTSPARWDQDHLDDLLLTESPL